MKAVAVHEDALVVTSSLWQTNAVAVRAGDEAMLVDSPYFPDEIELLPELLRQSGFEPAALLATHADWDHLLGPLAFPGASLGVAESTALRLRAEPGIAQRDLRAADDEHYVHRDRPLSLGTYHPLPVPGKLELGSEELELHPGEGHTEDGMIVFARWCGTLICGDYLSDVEIPTIANRKLYAATLQRLRPLVEAAEVVVPGHGGPQTSEEALRILEQDLAYIEGLESGRTSLPAGRDSPAQRRMHEKNLSGSP
jgi:glyoxylase-like metal-dependent hydrolase (beta-lactamase superfamily II)